MKEKEIIQLLQSGNIEKAFVRLYKLYPKVRAILKTNGAGKEQVADIFQDALVVLYQKLQQESFQLDISLEAYVLNTCKYMFLKSQRPVVKSVELAEQVQEDEDLEIYLQEDQKILRAETALKQIGEKCREILLSFYIAKMPMADIARRFSFATENVAKTQKYKCLEAARKTYRDLLNA